MKEVRISVIFDLVEGFERQTVKDEVWVTYETGTIPVVLDADMYALRDHAFRKMDARLDALKAHVRAVAEASAHPNGGKKSNGTGKGKPSAAGMLPTTIKQEIKTAILNPPKLDVINAAKGKRYETP